MFLWFNLRTAAHLGRRRPVLVRPARLGWLMAWVGLAVFQLTAKAAPPSASTLLPLSTKGYASTHDVHVLGANWDKTQYGQLMNDPVMAPFVDDLRQQLKDKWSETRLRLGVTWEDLEAIAGGEAAIGLVHAPQMKLPAQTMLVDITGKSAEAGIVLARIAKNLQQQGARRRQVNVAMTNVSVFDLPKRPGTKPRPAVSVYFVKDNMLCATDDLTVAQGILGRWGKNGTDTLAASPAFQAVMKRCVADAGEAKPDVRFFIVPLDFMAARRLLNPKSAGDDSRDLVKLLRNQGFGALQGAGGFLHFEAAEFDTLLRMAVYAPGPHQLAMRMLSFPNASVRPPEPWVPADVASYMCFNWDMRNAFEMSQTLVDEVYGEKGTFEDIIDSLKTDPNGPRVDLRGELTANLGNRVVVLFDYLVPITPSSEHRLFAAEASDPAAVDAAISKMMKSDKKVKRHEIDGQIIWEVPEEETTDDEEIPDLEIENPGDVGAPAEEEEEEDGGPELGEGRLLANSYLTVAHGHLFIASHMDLLLKVLRKEADQEAMSVDIDYTLVNGLIDREIQKRNWTEVSLRRFSRTDEEFRATYELSRNGQMPIGETMLAKLLNAALTDDSAEGPRKQEIDASKLPPYDAARRYFGPSGLVGISEPDGWFLINFTLRKDGPIAQAAPAAAAVEAPAKE